MKTLSSMLLLLFWVTAHATPLDPSKDYHSLSNPHDVLVKHLSLDLKVNFNQQVLEGFVILQVERKKSTANELILDTRDLSIFSAHAKVKGQWQQTEHKLEPPIPALGSALRIALPPTASQVKVKYRTSANASGLQWLQPIQTTGKKHPFLFTQAQAIHARSFIPLQDTPQVRVTYDATLRTPKALRAVMGAENDPKAALSGVFTFRMPQAIPSYLIALAVGDLEFKAMGKRTGVYAEKEILQAAADEFADTEFMLEATEKRFGPYSWGRYDLLILPASFPYGGMENPRLSFITPTVIAGDKSLVALIAHELAHSWSGNSVTNATWRDFWLNEGFTTYLTYRIMEIIYGSDRFSMESVLGYQDLEAALAEQPPEYQQLAVDLRGKDPDEAFSTIPYEKGALMLKEIEAQIGRKAFDKFLKQYFSEYAFQSLFTEQFMEYFEKTLVKDHPDKISLERIKQWIYEPGIPTGAPLPASNAFGLIDKQRQAWLNKTISSKGIEAKGWTVHEWLYFLNNMPEHLSPKQIKELDDQFKLTATRNNEIAHSWLLIAIRNDYQPAFQRLERYLVSIGRRKLITPLYKALMKTPRGQAFARKVYDRARPGYHPLAQGTMDDIVLDKN